MSTNSYSYSFKQIIKKIVYFILSPFIKNTGPDHSIYITFDDGPHQTLTLKVLEILKNYKINATFFFNGELIEKYPDIVAKVINDGHQIGYHSYYHKSLNGKNIFSIYKDLKIGKKLLKQHNINEYLYRPPYGHISLISLILLIINRWKIIMWSVEGRDSFDTEEEILKTLDVKNISTGSIILLHDVYEKTTNILPILLKNFKNSDLKPNKLTYK